MVPRIVLDTNVLVAASRSRRGASFALLSRVGTGAFDLVVSVPLVLEYEDALARGPLSTTDAQAIVDYICAIAEPQPIFFLWRPLLRDPSDDMVAEVAFAAGADFIVTFNRRDFAGVEVLGLKTLPPAQFLKRIP